jgi:hypothetical protein
VPAYRSGLSELETLSLGQLHTTLGGHNIVLVAPEGLDTKQYRRILGDRQCIYFDPRYFASRIGPARSYNALMVGDLFYRRFANWEWILVHQLDCYVFEDQLAQWTSSSYDYIAAPLVIQRNGVKAFVEGSVVGGFSLRRIESFLHVLSKVEGFRRLPQLLLPRSTGRVHLQALRGQLTEDLFWSQARLRVAPLGECIRFAFESGLEMLDNIYAEVRPFACHHDWNLEYIAALRKGVLCHREPHYVEILARLLSRSEGTQ